MTRRRRPRTSEERLISAVGSVARGVVGGRVRNVRPAASLDRNTGPGVAAGAVDFNADPTIIGPDAAAGSQSDPRFGTVIIGREAYADALSAVAVGYSARVDHSAFNTSGQAIAIGSHALADGHAVTAIAIGSSAHVSKPDAIAIGNSAESTGQEGIAIGVSASVSADDGVAIGTGARVTHASSVAIGILATTTATHQVMLGTSGETVTLPGQLKVLALPTTNPGVTGRVWNNGGVLTVSP